MTTIAFIYKEGRMVPLGRFRKEADSAFDEGNIYQLKTVNPRSAKSHAHYFACLKEAWMNLPEPLAMQFPNEDAMRAWSLIRTGWCDRRSLPCSSAAQAERVAAFIRGGFLGFSIVTIDGFVITEWTARSQSYTAMGPEDFQKSKTDVLDFLEDTISVARGSLMKKVTS